MMFLYPACMFSDARRRECMVSVVAIDRSKIVIIGSKATLCVHFQLKMLWNEEMKYRNVF
jgi:hypothetical protein